MSKPKMFYQEAGVFVFHLDDDAEQLKSFAIVYCALNEEGYPSKCGELSDVGSILEGLIMAEGGYEKFYSDRKPGEYTKVAGWLDKIGDKYWLHRLP